MVFNGDADGQDLYTVARELVNLPITDTTSFTVGAFARAANKILRTIWMWIFEAYGGWLYDDSNNTTDFPIATTDLVSGQQDYGLPPTALIVRGVDVKTVGGTWQRLESVTEEQIREILSDAEFLKTASQPMYYLAYGNSVRILPAANYAQVASLRASFARGSSSFASADTTKTPGFASEFHEAISVGGALEYAKRKQLPQAGGTTKQGSRTGLFADFFEYESRIKKYYRMRYNEMFPGRITVVDALREFM